MTIPAIAPLAPTADAIAQATQALARGQLLGLPTETVYGLAANAENPQAVRQIYDRKGRPAGHPLIVHIASAGQVAHFCPAVPAYAQTLMDAFWPGPLTLILPRRAGVADAVAGGQPTIGLRCPSHPVAQQVLQACLALPAPIHGLAAPSANRFGKVSPTRAEHVRTEFGDDLLILDGGACDVGIESTIVDCTREAPVVLRPGHIGASAMEDAINAPVIDPFAGHGDDSALQGPRPAAPGTLAAHYAPNAKVRLMDAKSIQAGLDILGPQARNMAVYARARLHSPSPHLILRTMPAQAAQAAHELFDVLRQLDGLGVKLIWVESPPADDAAWSGVRDRLQRAAASV